MNFNLVLQLGQNECSYVIFFPSGILYTANVKKLPNNVPIMNIIVYIKYSTSRFHPLSFVLFKILGIYINDKCICQVVLLINFQHDLFGLTNH